MNITLYSLSSYAEIMWSNVLIKYNLENINRKKVFESFIKKLFPKEVILHERSDFQEKI